jgi:subtilisin family serine protease
LVTITNDAMLLRRRAGSGFKGYVSNTYANAATTRLVANQLSREYSLREVDNWPISVLDVHCVVYELTSQDNVEQLIARLDADPRVESVQAMHRFELQASNNSPVVYNDPYFALQSGWRELALEPVYRLVTGKGVRIALIDTAVESRHPDLKARIRSAKSFLPEPGRSTGDFHGTAVAGVVAAEANNRIGIAGVAPEAELLCLEACWRESGKGAVCDSFTLAQALNYAITQRVRIINLSLAGPEDPLLRRLLDVAVANGIAVVAARSDSTKSPFPSSVPGVIAVGHAGQKLPVQGIGHTVLVSAPAQDVLTTVPTDAYDFVSGSSIAAAHVTGAVALLFEWKSSLTGQNLTALLRPKALPSVNEPVNAPLINVCALFNKLGMHDIDPTFHCDLPALASR